ncbi:tRNA1(Val) (adenine(37)-N6)-methyltransferase [Weissella minor]|uniref:Methyltransferase n=1 Tax=Weissella minor TaxID=1620 RepID=A0A0R2JRI6_9LACO|nr:tRNA1(Val) (adenine(37)-N6)-methyltransferase [Weissella minor]KRN76733.1 methyltransferase [Weissella minor]
MDVQLKPGERIDMLYSDQVHIIQSKDVFSFSLDAVLLANFANPRKSGRGLTVDLGTGNGAIPLFMAHKVQGKLLGVEIQPQLAEMAQRSVEMNELTDKIEILNADMRDIFETVRPGSADTVVSNPPYFSVDSEKTVMKEDEHYAIARHEIKADLALVTKTANKLLKNKAHFFMVHRPDRLFEIIDALRAAHLSPKKLQFVYPKPGSEANIVLIDAIKDGDGTGARILPPIITHNPDGSYRQEILDIYEGNQQHD